MRHVLACVLLCSAAAFGREGGALDEARFEAVAKKGIDEVYNLRFEAAEKTFNELVALRPADPAGPFFLAMVDWWRIVIDMDNLQYDDKFFAELDRVVEMCDSLLEKNPNDVNAMFFKGGAIGFRGRLKFHRNDYLAAANAGRQALPLVQSASEMDPTNLDILLGTGMYNYYAEVIPNEYPFVKPLLLFVPRGDREKGLQQLETVAEHGRYASVETSYFLMQIYFYYEKDFPKALAIAKRLFARFPSNMLFHRYLGRCQSSLGDWVVAADIFGEIAKRCQEHWRGYTTFVEREAEYYMGYTLMNARRYDEALPHLFRCDELSRSLDAKEISGFMIMANLKAGNIFDIQGKRDLACAQYRKVLDMKDYQDSHKQAKEFLEKPAEY